MSKTKTKTKTGVKTNTLVALAVVALGLSALVATMGANSVKIQNVGLTVKIWPKEAGVNVMVSPQSIGGPTMGSPGPGTYSYGYKKGTQVQITLQPDYNNYKFIGWNTSACKKDSLSCKITMNSDQAIIANFQLSGLTCKATNSKDDIYNKGTVIGTDASGKNYSKSDFCSDSNSMHKMFCNSDGTIGEMWVNCNTSSSAGCDKNKGVCKKKTTTSTSCKDSDGGINYYVKGTACSGNMCFTDSCQGMGREGVLEEANCNATNKPAEHPGLEWVEYTCPKGCSNGACIK